MIRREVRLTLIAIVSSLTILVALFKLEIPYPLLPFLKFDLAEVFPFFYLILTNIITDSILVELVHFIFLLYRSAFTPIGPLMKFMAVTSMLIGYWIGLKLVSSIKSKTSLSLIPPLLLSILLRCTIMSIANYLVLVWIAPYFLILAEKYFREMGFLIHSTLTTCMIVIGIFNFLHTLMSFILAYYMSKIISHNTKFLRFKS